MMYNEDKLIYVDQDLQCARKIKIKMMKIPRTGNGVSALINYF